MQAWGETSDKEELSSPVAVGCRVCSFIGRDCNELKRRQAQFGCFESRTRPKACQRGRAVLFHARASAKSSLFGILAVSSGDDVPVCAPGTRWQPKSQLCTNSQ